MSNLVERLLEVAPCDNAKPICQEAAARIIELEAEVKRLRLDEDNQCN